MHNGKFELVRLTQGEKGLSSSLLANFPLLAIYFWRLTKRSETSKKDKAKEADKAQGRNSLAGGQNKSAHTDKPVDTLHKWKVYNDERVKERERESARQSGSREAAESASLPAQTEAATAAAAAKAGEWA